MTDEKTITFKFRIRGAKDPQGLAFELGEALDDQMSKVHGYSLNSEALPDSGGLAEGEYSTIGNTVDDATEQGET